MAAGITAALTAPWPGMLVFAGVLALSVGLAARARTIAVIVEPEPTRPALEPITEEHEKQARDDDTAPIASHPIDTPAMVAVPGGTFWMGSAEDDEIADEDERPVRLVQVSPFSCMKYPVTRLLWLEVMGTPHGWWPEGLADDRPVNNVSWYDAVRFCNALSKREGLAPCYLIEGDEVVWVSSEGYRLPTEAEWEYACRAKTRTQWSFGDDATALGDYSWFDGNAGDEPRPVGLKQPNTWGLHDMHGNVWEWCWDWYASYHQASAGQPEINPPGAKQGTSRVLRGGSFAFRFGDLRCANRYWGRPGSRDGDFGFRCVRGSAGQS